MMMMATATAKLTLQPGCLNDAGEQVIIQPRRSGNIARTTMMMSVLLMVGSRHSSHDTHIRRPSLSWTKEGRDRPQGAVITDVYWCYLLLTRVEGAPDRAARDGRRGGGGDSGLIFLSPKILGHPGERGDYQEINSKTGLALLTSQGSAVQGPHGSGCQYRPVLLRI